MDQQSQSLSIQLNSKEQSNMKRLFRWSLCQSEPRENQAWPQLRLQSPQVQMSPSAGILEYQEYIDHYLFEADPPFNTTAVTLNHQHPSPHSIIPSQQPKKGRNPPQPKNPPSRSLKPKQHITETKQRKSRRKNPPKRNDYRKNITKVITHRAARQYKLIPMARQSVLRMLDSAGINQSEFDALLNELLRRHYITNTTLLKMYLAPHLGDLKKIFAEYFMLYLENFAVMAFAESDVEELYTYIQYSRKYLAYLAEVEDGIVQPSPNIRPQE